MRYTRLKVCALTRSELQAIREEANLTAEEEKLLDLLNKGDRTDVGMMLDLGVTHHHYYRLKKVLCAKVDRIARAKGYGFIV